MGNQIDAMTPLTAPAGTELMFADDSGPKSVTMTVVKEFVVDQIEAITPAGSVAAGNDLMAIQSGVLVPVDIDLVTQRALDILWAKSAVVTPVGADTLPFSDAGVEKTVTMTVLAEAVRGIIEATILDVSDLTDGSSGIATTDYMLVTVGTTAKRIQISDISTLIYASLAAHVTGKSAISTPVDADELYVVRGGTAYKITLAQIATHAAASATVSGSGTTDLLTQWSSSSVLKAGPAIIASATGFTVGADTALPTTKAVRDEMDKVIYDATDIGAALVDADTFLVDDGAAGTTQRKSALSRLATYLLGYFATAADMTEGAGISGATGEICEHSVTKSGGLFKTEILVDLTTLQGGAGINDIIGLSPGTADCHIGQITAAVNGTIIAGRVTCFEVPAGGDPDVDLWSADESTGAQDADIAGLTGEIQHVDHGDWAAEQVDYLTTLPAADQYLYLTQGAATDVEYTAGIFLIELWGK